MSRVRGKNTSSEILVRKALHRRGFRFRIHVAKLPGNPDIVLPKFSTVVFVNGCLWHGHQCSKFRWPVSNESYWKTKITKTQNRDAYNITELTKSGWSVEQIWDCNATNDIKSLITRLSNIRSRNERALIKNKLIDSADRATN